MKLSHCVAALSLRAKRGSRETAVLVVYGAIGYSLGVLLRVLS